MAELDVYKEWLGIPEGDRPPDFYTLLRLVQFEDDQDKIQANYRKLNAHVRKYATGQYLKASQDLLNEMAKAMLCLTDATAKRDYDESQGREFAADQTDEPTTVLQYLEQQGIVKHNQVSEIEHYANARGISTRDAVVQMNLADAEQAARGLAVELRMPFVDLAEMLPEDDVLDKLPRQVVKRHSCLPLFEDRGKLMVACTGEPTPELEDEVRLRYGMPIRPVLAVPRSVQQAIAKYYASGMRDDSVAELSGGGKSKKQKAKSRPKPTVKSAPLSEDAKTERKQIGMIIIMWSLIGTVLGLYFSGVMDAMGNWGTVISVMLGAVVAAVVTGILKLTYWK